jgi:LytS/YehU family sensor histidine kinase
MTLTVPLEKQLRAVQLYVQMEAMRFDNKFTYELLVHPGLNVSNIEVFPLIMQPYIENAIWHGLMHKTNGAGIISIHVNTEGKFLIYTIEDNGVGREYSMSRTLRRRSVKKSFGLQITHDRLKLLTEDRKGESSSVDIQDLKDKNGQPSGTRVIIKIPLPEKNLKNSDPSVEEVPLLKFA